jgi:RIO kinase 2
MRNHEYVPAELIARIGKLRGGETFKIISKLLKNKFITHINKKCKHCLNIDDGYKLTYLGYDYLALQTFIKRGVIKDVINKIGVGK